MSLFPSSKFIVFITNSKTIDEIEAKIVKITNAKLIYEKTSLTLLLI